MPTKKLSRYFVLCCLSLSLSRQKFLYAFSLGPWSRQIVNNGPRSKHKDIIELREKRVFGEGKWTKSQRPIFVRNSSDALESRKMDRGEKLLKLRQVLSKNFFLVGMFVAVATAKIFPALGNDGGILKPELFIGKYGVTFIFLLSGLSLELRQLSDAASNHSLTALIQLSSFLAWPYLVGLPLKTLFSTVFTGVFPSALLDGLLILTCLPTTVNMCVILTSSAGGNTAAALWNAVISNLGGIFFTPALLLRFFGTTIEIPFLDMFLKLCKKVLLPVVIGQALRATPMKDVYASHSKWFKRAQELVLLSILWNAFCTAACNSMGMDITHGISLLLLLASVHVLSLGALSKLFSSLKFSRKDVIAAMFCSSQKTLAFGLPLIKTIFEGNPNLATYCAPLMLIHPLQLMIGSALIPRLEKYIKEEDSG